MDIKSELECKEVNVANNDTARNYFLETYLMLVNTLADTYTDIIQISNYRTRYLKMTEEEKTQIVSTYYQEFKDVIKFDANLFIQSLTSLKQLYIPALWVQDRFSEASKTYLFLYLRNLRDHAITYIKQITPTTNIIENPGDICPPTINSEFEQFQQLAGINPNTMARVRQVTDVYEAKLKSGEETMDQIDLGRLSKDIFAHLGENDLQQMMQGMGTMMQNLMQNGGTDQLQNLFESVQQMQKPISKKEE